MRTILLLWLSLTLAPAGTIYLRNDGPSPISNNVSMQGNIFMQQGISGSLPATVTATFVYVGTPWAVGTSKTLTSSGLTASQRASYLVYASQALNPMVLVGRGDLIGEGDAYIPIYSYDKPDCITNSFAATLANPENYPQTATFKKGGEIVYQTVCQPGGVVNYTFTWCEANGVEAPRLDWGLTAYKTSVFADGSGNYDIVTNGRTNNVGLPFGFTNTYSVTDSANALSNTNQAINFIYGDMPVTYATALTNSNPITWNNGDTTAARDATMRAGFNKLAMDNENQLNALAMINQSVQASSGGGSTNDNSGVIGAIENFHRDNTNLLTDIRDILGSTNGTPFDTNEMVAAGTAAAGSVATSIGTLTNGSDFALTIPTAAPGSSWTLSIPLAGAASTTMNLNPFSASWVVELAALFKSIVRWSMIAAFMLFAGTVIFQVVTASGSARQATTSGTTVLGSNINTASAFAMAGLITIAFTVLIVGLVSSISSYLGEFYISPWAGASSGAVQTAVWLAYQFLPLDLFVSLPVAMFVTRAGATLGLWVAQTITRFLVGL